MLFLYRVRRKNLAYFSLSPSVEPWQNAMVAPYSFYLALAGPSGIRAGWGIKISGRLEAESPPVTAGPLSAGRATLYSTGPCCPV